MKKDYLNQFVLVGGTALALHMGHRKSLDLDLFSNKEFETEILVSQLLQDYKLQIVTQTPQSIVGTIENIKVDFIRFKYPFIRPIVEVDRIRLLEVEDIGPMKLDAISGRGSKKDFYDLYFLLQKYNLDSLFSFFMEKYPHQTTFHIAKSLTYFVDAENEPDPYVFNKEITWEKVKKKICAEIQKL